MYYVLMTDVVRIPSPSLEAAGQYLFGMSVTGHLAPNAPPAPPPAPPPPMEAADPDLRACVVRIKTGSAADATIAAELGPIAPWTWATFDGVTLTNTTATVQTPVIGGPVLDGTFALLKNKISDHLNFNQGAFLVDNPPAYMPFRGRSASALTSSSISVGTNMFSYEGFVASLGAAPAPLPQSQMNLVRFFTVSEAQLRTLSAAATLRVVAIPVFTITIGTPPRTVQYVGTAPTAATCFPIDPANNVVQWQYASPFNVDGKDCKIVAYAQLLDPRALIDSPNSFVDMKTLWVRREHGITPAAPVTGPSDSDAQEGVSLDDWVQNLPGNVARLFDLPRRFLDLFRDQDGVFIPVPLVDPTDPTKADPIGSRRLVHGVLRALYDVLAPGIWGTTGAANSTPARNGLAQTTALALYADALADPNPAKTAADKKQLIDSIVAALTAQDIIIHASFAPTTENWIKQPSLTNAFCDALAMRVGASLGLPQNGSDFIAGLFGAVGSLPSAVAVASPPSDTQSLNLDILDRLIALATSPKTAASIYADLWKQAIQKAQAQPGGLNLPSSKFSIEDLATKLGLPDAQRRQIASFALATGGILASGAESKKDTGILQDNIVKSLAGYLLGTLALSSAATPLDDPEKAFETFGRASCFDRAAIPGQSAAAPLGNAQKVLAGIVQNWVPQSDSAQPPQFKAYDFVPAQRTTATANGLNFQIDRVVPGDSVSTQGDFKNLLAGFGILMRRSLLQLTGADPSLRQSWTPLNAEKWRLLNAVQGAPGIWPLVTWPDPLNPGGTIQQPGPAEPVTARFKALTVPAATSPLELLAPIPIATAAGMPRVSFQYNNAPPSGRSGPSQITHSTSPEMADGAPSIFHLIQPVATDNPPTRQLLPFLAYGMSYDLIVFAMTNQGALPEELRDPATPAVVLPGDLDLETLLTANKFANLVRSARYLRTTSVGHLGFDTDLSPSFVRAKNQAQTNGFDPFQIPKDIALIAAEIPGLLRPFPALVADASGKPIQPVEARKACLLLADANNKPLGKAGSRTFAVSAPACPLEVLDRWLARDEYLPPPGVMQSTIRQLRHTIRTLFAIESSDRQKIVASGNPLAAPDSLKFDDPAVIGLVVTAQLYRHGGKPAARGATIAPPTFAKWPSVFDQFLQAGGSPPAPAKLADLVRKDATITLVITKGQAGVTATDGTFTAGPTVTIAANSGDVVLVKIQAAVRADHFKVDSGSTARFDPIVLSDPNAIYTDPSGIQYHLFDANEIVLEAAQPNLPAADALYDACKFRVAPGNGQRQIVLDWQPTTQDLTWDAVGSLETGDIAWSFTGRPVTRYPFEADANAIPSNISGKADTPASNPLLWEVEAFADRATLAPAVKVFAVPLQQTTPPSLTTIPIQTLGSRGPAGIKRFEIVVRNRYAAAYQKVTNTGFEASKRATRTSANPPWSDVYKRLVVPAVPPDTVPTPSLRALVPLTRSMDDAGDGNAVAGLLVILDGAFGDIGGVAEWLDAGVDVVTQKIPVDKFPSGPPGGAVPAPPIPNSPPKYVVQRAEIGADPLVRRGPRGDDLTAGKPLVPNEGYQFMPLGVSGPLGHTFDTAATVGLFNATSFVIEPPQVAAADPGAWWMAKLKLRRTILAEGIGFAPASVVLPKSGDTAVGNNVGQWSVTLSGLPLGTASPGTSYITVTGTRAADGAKQSVCVCWAKLATPAIAVWISLVAPTAGNVPDEAWRIAIPPVPQQVAGVTPPPMSVDLRVLFAPLMKRVLDSATATYKIVLSYDVALQSRAENDWTFAGDCSLWANKSSYLPDGTYEERLAVTMARSDSLANPLLSAAVCVAPQVSDWVTSHWGQFLPEANRLGNVKLGDVVVTLAQGPTPLLITNANWWLSTSGLATAVQKSNQGLFHLLLVSRRVRSANGRDSEAYLGLYWDDRQPVPSNAPLGLKLFTKTTLPITDPLSGGSSANLRWRLLTVRTGNPNMSSTDIQNGLDLLGDPWRLFFPDERDGGIDVVPDQPSDATMMPRDSYLQIIEISKWHAVKPGS